MTISIPNIKKMTSKARNATRRDLRFSAFTGLPTKKIISVILLLSLPTGVRAVSLSGLLTVATAFGAYLAPVIQRVSTPVAYAGALKVGLSEVKTFMSDQNTKIYSAIVAAIAVLLILQRVYSSRTNRMRITLETMRLSHNAEQRRLNREAANRMANRQLQMFNMMIKGQGTVVKQAVQEAVALTRPMLLQLEAGRDPVVPVPRITGSRAKQN